METTVFKIEKNNINRTRYLNVMNSWNKNSDYKINREASLYAVAFGEMILGGASVMVHDNTAKVLFFNNSNNHEKEVKEAGMMQLEDLLNQEFGSIEKAVQYVKVG